MIGQVLGHYRVLAQIGSGGMGVVYRGHDLRLDREVAVKVLPSDAVADTIARARLIREARTASALNHPHICTIHEVGEDADQVFIAMELVEGRAISEMIGASGLASDRVIQYGIQIADALAHAHGRSVIHRDLKSANVMVTAERRVKVLDFGLARHVATESTPTVASPGLSPTEGGVVVGTPHYLAPEVLQGHRADARSDLWAFGVLLYEMACGVLPFIGQSAFEVGGAILMKPPRPLPESVPAGLRSVIARCLRKDPEERYQRASEVRAALEVVQSDPGIVSRTPSTAQTDAAQVPNLASGRLAGTSPRNWAVLAPLLGVLLASLWALNPGGWRDRFTPLAPEGPITSIAVLPVVNSSGDPRQEFFADGMTEELIATLAQIASLRVTSRTSVMHYKGTRKSIREIGRELGVDAVLEGTVLRSGGRVRVTAKLIRAAVDQSVWAETYDRDARDLFALQTDVARAIAEQIRAKVTPREQVRLATMRRLDPAAHESYLEGRYYWNKRTEPDLTRAISYFRLAIARDSSYALAYAGLADSYGLLPDYGRTPKDQVMPLAREAALRALEIDSSLAEAHASLGNVEKAWTRDWNAAEREYRRAIELDPNYATAHHWYAVLLAWTGRLPEAVVEMERARLLDPLSPIIRLTLGRVYYLDRRYGDAATEFSKVIELDARRASAYAGLSSVYFQQAKYQDAAAAWARSYSLVDSVGAAGAARSRGHVTSARRYLNQRLTDTYVLVERGKASSAELAAAYAAFSDHDRAFEWLERAYRDHSLTQGDLASLPEFDGLRSDPRYAVLLSTIRRAR